MISIWLDTLSRELIEDGGLAALMTDHAVSGATSNPTIFAKAMMGTDRYDEQLRAALDSGVDDPRELFLELALEDVRRAASMMRPLYEAGRDGFVSFEVTPDVAYDTEATVEQALELWRRLDAPNVMIKVPATEPGVGAIEELTARGVNVNVTLLLHRDSERARRVRRVRGALRGPGGSGWQTSEPVRSGRCGQARRPRTPPTATSSTWSSSRCPARS